MRRAFCFLLLIGLAITAAGGNPPKNLPALACSTDASGLPSCMPSAKDLKEARAAFAKGMKLQNADRGEEALEQFEIATRLMPQAIDYVTAREMARQQVIFDHLQRGNAEMLQGRQIEAQAEFRSALHMDPQNEFAQQRVRDAYGEWAPRSSASLQVLEDAGEVRVDPKPTRVEFHYRGDSRALLTQVAAAFGVVSVFDDSVVSRRVRFDIDNVDFYTAMRAAGDVTRTFWTAMSAKEILLASESPENHRLFDRMSLRTFRVPGASTPQDLTDVSNLLRNVFEIRFITPQPQTSTLVVRAPQSTLDAATKFMEGLADSRPQVMLDVRTYQISHRLTRDMGIHIPNEFTLFNIPAAALVALGGQNIQDLINQLIAGGGINQAGSEAIAGLLAQLQGQQSSIFSQGLATFGGGQTLMGLSLGTLSATLSLNESSVKALEHVTLRVAQGNEATFRIGMRYPILNASFSPVFNTPAISQAIQNNSFVAPVPSVNYEDLGFNLKAKPVVNGNSDVALSLEVQFRSLQGQSFNGVPVISNREYKGSITLVHGEPAMVAGSVSHQELRSMNGIPGLGAVPGLNKIMTSNSKEEDDDELLLIITPYIVLPGSERQNSEVWMTK